MHKTVIIINLALLLSLLIAEEKTKFELGEEFIFNGECELGENSRPVPGFFLRNWLLGETAYKSGDKTFFPESAPGGITGTCMKVPGIKGRPEYNLESGWFDINRDGEAEISFYVKSGPDEQGNINNTSVILDFRCYNLNIQHGTVKERYPVLESKSFRPESEWKKYSYIFRVKKGFPYSIWFRAAAKDSASLIDTLYFDKISLRMPKQTEKTYNNELASFPDKNIPAYRHSGIAVFNIHALLDSTASKEKLKAVIIDDNDSSVYKQAEILLLFKKNSEQDAGTDPRSLYTGQQEIKTDRFGSFSAEFYLNDKKINSRGGDFAVIHPLVDHPRFSPGWSIGIGGIESLSSCNITPGNTPVILTTSSIGTTLALCRLAGIKLLRYWCHWNTVEEQKGEYSGYFIGEELKLYRKFNFDPILMFGCTFTHAPDMNTPDDKIKGRLPVWLYKECTVRPGVVVPPEDAWKKYVEFILKNFSRDFYFWEIVNEPGNGWKPEEYLPLQKIAYELIKKYAPDSVVLGNGATGDLGQRPIGWTEDLAKLGHEAFLDAVAFHPYGASLDSMGGNFFKYSDLVDGLRRALKVQKPLYCTECYYIESARRKQGKHGLEQSTFKAGDIQRHHLNALLCGVIGSASICDASLIKRRSTVPMDSVPGEVLAGMNTLSFLLSNMTDLENIHINKFIKAGIFSAKDKTSATGFIWDLRPGGSLWQVPPEFTTGGNVLFFDHFGNTLSPSAEIKNTLDPLFLKGRPEAIKKLLLNSKFTVENPVTLKARSFSNRLYIESMNTTGLACSADVRLSADTSLRLPESLHLLFDRNKYSLALLHSAVPLKTGAVLNWECFINGTKNGAGGLDLLPDTGCYILPFGIENLTLKMSKGSQISFGADEKYLRITARVKDDQIINAKDNSLWEGDALEIFIDTNPFYRMDLDAVFSGDEKMNCLQYVFAVKPSIRGDVKRSFHRRKTEFITKGVSETKETGDGYVISAAIPWEDLAALFAPGEILGIDCEIDNINTTGKSKESLGIKPGESYKMRLHYPLFKIPGQVYTALENSALQVYGISRLKNPDFEIIDENVPSDWQLNGDGLKLAKSGKKFGFQETCGVVITVSPGQETLGKQGAQIYQRITCMQNSHKQINFQFMVKLDDLKKTSDSIVSEYQKGFYVKVHYYDGTNKKHGANEGMGLQKSILGTQRWTKMQFFTSVPDTATEITVSAGLSSGVTGSVSIDDIDMYIIDKK